MIFQDSRYETADVLRMQTFDGSTRLTVVPPEQVTLEVLNFAYYTCVEGDRIDILADRYYGDAELWWVIADANPQWSYFDWLPAGTMLRIPSGIRAR